MNARTLFLAVLAAACLACFVPPALPQNPPPTATQNLIDQCQRSGQFAAADCARWAMRNQEFQQSACPDKRAATACRSFRELLRDSDPGLMNDFARQDHIYICFIPGADEFFKVTYSEPLTTAFTVPAPEQIKQGVPPTALTAPGESDFSYFTNGVRDSDGSLHNLGNWIYLPPVQADPETMRRNADFREAHFKGKNIAITNDEWRLAESYQNDTDNTIKHTVTVQLATGRFRQEFALASSGKVQVESDGRCLIAPTGPQ